MDNLPLRIYERLTERQPGHRRVKLVVLVLLILILFVIALLICLSKPGQHRLRFHRRPCNSMN